MAVSYNPVKSCSAHRLRLGDRIEVSNVGVIGLLGHGPLADALGRVGSIELSIELEGLL